MHYIINRSEQSKLTNSFNTAITNRLAQLDTVKKIRKDAVVMAQAIVSASSDTDFIYGCINNHELSKNRTDDYFASAYLFLCEKYGEENIISAYVYFDEATPHMHVNFVPVTSDGRLSAKDLFARGSGELRKLQTEFYEEVGKPFGLNRGEEGSKTKHKSTAQFKLDKINQQIADSEAYLANICAEIKYNRNERANKQAELSAVEDEIVDKLQLIEQYDQVLHDFLVAEKSELDEYHKSKQESIQQPLQQIHTPQQQIPPEQAPQPQQPEALKKKKYTPSR